MKKFIGLFFILINLSCSFLILPIWIPLNIETIEDAAKIMQTIKYKLDNNNIWKTPQETYESQEGDCEDMSALFACLLIYSLNEQHVRLAWFVKKSNQNGHMAVLFNGKYYEGETGEVNEDIEKEYSLLTTISYDTYIFLARRD